MTNSRQPAAANGKMSRKPDVKINTHKPMDKTESAQSERPKPDSGFSLLLDLPPELRVRIYEYAVWTDGECLITKVGGVPEPPLLTTSKTVRREAIDVYHSINAMRFVVISYDRATETLMFRKLGILEAKYGVKASFAGAAFIGSLSWTNLKSRLQSLHEGKGKHVSFGNPAADKAREFRMVVGMMHSVVVMRSLPWKEAETKLELLQVGLIAIDDRWASNRSYNTRQNEVR
jgi:hypothetical protein